MWSDGQRLERHEVEAWIAAAFPYPHFKARVVEKEEPQHSRIRVTITVTGPNGEPCIAVNHKAVYHSLKSMPGMVQFSEDWTA